jgi:predicted transport protein
MLKYYANYTGKNWMSDTVMKIVHLQQDKRDLQDEVDELKKDIQEAYILENDDTLSLNDLRTFYHEHRRDSAVEEEQRDIVIRLRNEINALNYNMDHAYNLGDGKFLSLDDLCTFYEDNKNIHDVVRQQHNRILLLGLELKALQKPKEETFSTMPRQEFEKRAEAAALKAAENVKFDTYTEGFRKGFDLGYEKAKDQYYE